MTEIDARREVIEVDARNTGTESEGEKGSVNEWLPENLTTPKKRAKGKRK